MVTITLYTYDATGGIDTSCRGIVPLPRRVAIMRRPPFVVGGGAHVLCPRKSTLLGGGTRFLTNCVGRSAKGRLSIRITRRKGSKGTVLLRASATIKRPRKCRLAITRKGIEMGKEAPGNVFCNLRALQGSVPTVTAKTSIVLPTVSVGSTPQFNCHKVVLSMKHRFFSIRFIGECVSLLTLRGVGCFR